MNSENGLNGDMRILLADDHDMVRDTISAYLSSEGGAQITATTDLPRAMKELEDNGPFDLVLLDYNMPGMNGLDGLQRAALRSCRAAPRHALRRMLLMLARLASFPKPWGHNRC